MEKTIKDYQISIYQDTRRKKKNGNYPVRLRVFTANPRKQKLYSTKFEFTKQEFDVIWNSNIKPRGKNKEYRLMLQDIENRANNTADSIGVFTFEEFEVKFFSKQNFKIKTVNELYKRVIEQYIYNKKINTASNYRYSLKSLLKFDGKKDIYFNTITPQWLKDYQNFMLTAGKNKTTIGIYLRPLRAIFTTAIEEGLIDKDKYPFGKRKFVIPNPKTIKTSLSKKELKILFEGKPANEYQQKAKDFWFFSYACNGMNVKDIALLQYKNLKKDDIIVFYRNKSKDTNAEQKPIIIYVNDFIRSVIEKYCNERINDETYIFPIISNKDKPTEQQRHINNFNRYINQHINKYAKHIGLDIKINPKIARHSFATNLIRNGAGLKFAQEQLGHSTLKVTQNYFTGFADEHKKEILGKIMDFD